jgi:hypothetical protein
MITSMVLITSVWLKLTITIPSYGGSCFSRFVTSRCGSAVIFSDVVCGMVISVSLVQFADITARIELPTSISNYGMITSICLIATLRLKFAMTISHGENNLG